MKTHHPLLLLAMLSLLAACKTSAPRQATTPAITTDTTTYYITQEGDTLPNLHTEVPVDMFRVWKDTVTTIGVGDIMLGTNFPDSSYLPPDSGRYLLAGVAPILQQADLTFGNLEGVLLDSAGTQKHCNNPDVCYLFRMPEYLAGHLKEAGFDLMSTANNHAGDFGDEGRFNTIKVLDSLGIQHAGLLQQPFVLFEHSGVRWGMAAFSPNVGTQSINDHEAASQIVAHLDSLSDIVIVSFHGGAEGNKYQHVTRETEEFYGENRGNVYKFSHRMVDAGADIIFGHGPHVTRAVEVYKDRFIAYSLGNFATYARFNLRNENGLAPIVKVYIGPKGKFFKAEVTPIIQIGEGIPVIDEEKRAIKILQNLTKEDFPEVPLQITDEGIIFQQPKQ
ncbi:CapA family protein [Nafulsella turpanensis]|uniref:CapA family protein n=1 Tax=Nafulsella turpanensis TaxID=1265690 RepID=UPI00034B46B9|nr:CapA family protein [Nafulsella turpanensis]